VFAASPETNRKKPQEIGSPSLSRPRQDLAACALSNPVLFFTGCGLRYRAVTVFCGYERPFFTINGQQIRHHLSRYGERCAISMPFLLLFLIDRSQFVTLVRCKLGSFHQYTLNLFVALFGEWDSQHFLA